MHLLLSPHDDDAALFGSFTLLREKPLVCIVTDAWIQTLRGELGCDHRTRANETLNAHEILGVPTVRLGIRDNLATEENITEALRGFGGFDTVYAPALQGGNKDHDAVSRAATKVFRRVRYYTTYSPNQLYTTGNEEIKPTDEEENLKLKALMAYKSQINLPATAPHFRAVVGKPEWLL